MSLGKRVPLLTPSQLMGGVGKDASSEFALAAESFIADLDAAEFVKFLATASILLGWEDEVLVVDDVVVVAVFTLLLSLQLTSLEVGNEFLSDLSLVALLLIDSSLFLEKVPSDLIL